VFHGSGLLSKNALGSKIVPPRPPRPDPLGYANGPVRRSGEAGRRARPPPIFGCPGREPPGPVCRESPEGARAARIAIGRFGPVASAGRSVPPDNLEIVPPWSWKAPEYGRIGQPNFGDGPAVR